MTDHTPEPVDTPPRSPWVLIDDLTVEQSAEVLDRLTTWLTGPDKAASARCALALSLHETNDPISLASWTDALAARLHHLADQSQIPVHPRRKDHLTTTNK